MAESDQRPPDEHYIAAGTTGPVVINFALPQGQYLKGKVVDEEGNGIADALVQVRYYEPDKPIRRTAFNNFERTDADGLFLLQAVGIDVEFVVDVLADEYLPKSSKRFKRAAEDTLLDDIVLDRRGGTAHVQVLDSSGALIGGVRVHLSADPAGYTADERGSLLHGRVYNQRADTSGFGNVLFTRVPPGRIRFSVYTQDGEIKKETSIAENEQVSNHPYNVSVEK